MSTASRRNVFHYTALGNHGNEVAGELTAVSEDAARRELASRGILILTLDAKQALRLRPSRTSLSDLALGLRILTNLIESGLPITQALSVFADLAPGRWALSVEGITTDVAAGKSLSHALSGTNGLEFPPTVIGLIRSGEAGAGLVVGLRAATDWAERAAADRSALRGAFAYPLVVAAAGAISIAVMVGWVLPRFAEMLAQVDQTPPRLTKLILDVVSAVRIAALPGLVLSLGIVAAIKLYLRSPEGARRWHDAILRVPLIGRLRFATLSSHVLASLSAMLESGVPMPTAIMLAGEAAGDEAIERRMLAARSLVTDGQSLAQALAATSAVSATALRVVAAGEESGRLAHMLGHAAQLERSRAAAETRLLLRILEPTLLLFVAGTVGVIASAMLQAIYSIRPVP